MTTPISKTPAWKHRLSDYFVFLWFLSLSLYLSQQRIFPYLYDDEYGVLGSAAVFSGLDWITPTAMPFYGFLLSLITFPVYWLDLEPTMMYRTIIAVNAVLVATTALLAIKTIRMLFENQSEIDRIAIIIAAFSYPAVLYFSAMAMTETTLLFCFFLIAYHLTSLLHAVRPRMLNAVLLGLGIGLAPYAHSRGIAFVFAGVFVILYSLRKRSIAGKFLVAIAVSATFFTLILAYIKTYLLANFYSHEQVSSSVVSFLDSRLALLNFHDLISLALAGIGQFTYLITSSFGLLLSGVSILLFVTWRYFLLRKPGLEPGPDKINDDAIGLLSGFVLLSFLIMFTVSVMAVFKGQRADHVFYGRYNEVLTPALVIVSLGFLTQLPNKAAFRWVMAGFIFAIFSLVLINFYPQEVFERQMWWLSVTSWFVYIDGSWKIDPEMIMLGSGLAFAVLAVSLAVSRKLFVFVLIAFFTSTTFHNFEIQHKGADIAWADFSDLSNKLGKRLDGMNLQATGGDWTTNLKGEALQFAFPRAQVRFDDQDLETADAVLDYSGVYCSDKSIVAQVRDASFCIVSERLQGKLSDLPLVVDLHATGESPLVGIELPDKIESDGFRLGTIQRVCAILSRGYYTGWFRYCLPSIDIKLTQTGPQAVEDRRLGFYIVTPQGRWLYEWRVEINNQQLAQQGLLQINPRLQLPAGIPSGTYWLNIATVDDSDWDFRTNQKIKLIIK